jgi:hypothetical protein
MFIHNMLSTIDMPASTGGGISMKGTSIGVGAIFSAVIASRLFASNTSLAQVVVADVQVRPTSVPNSCDFGVFEPEIRITNTGDHFFFLSQVFLLVYFDAGQDEIQAVHPEGTTAAIFERNGAFRSWDSISIRKFQDFAETQFAPDRLANQSWQINFGPINPPGLGPDVTVPVGGFADLIVTFQRTGGAFPFDVGCKNFTRVERSAPANFASNKFYNLFFTSTQQFLCEFLAPGVPDPNSGISPFPPFASACPSQ